MARNAVAGIYSITHKSDGKVYVGQSRDIAKRIRHHEKWGKYCTNLYKAIDCYGWDAFDVAVLEEVNDYSSLSEREQYWIDALESQNPEKGYNIQKAPAGRISFCGDGRIYSTNVRFPAEMKDQMQRAAEEEFRSVNGFIVAAVSQYLKEHDRRRGRKAQETEPKEA